MPEKKHAEEKVADWMRAHRALLEVARERSALEAREGKVLLWALRAGVHVNLGLWVLRRVRRAAVRICPAHDAGQAPHRRGARVAAGARSCVDAG